MKLWQSHPEGTVIPVRVWAGARRNQLQCQGDGLLRVWLTQRAEKGKANQALLEMLADVLGVRKSQLEILSGHHSPQKRLLVRVSPEQLQQILSASS